LPGDGLLREVDIFSLCPLTVLPCSPLEQIDAALEAGFDSVGIRLLPVLPTDIDVMADKPLRAAIARRLSHTGLKVLDVEVVRISGETDVEALVPMLQYAGDIGARSLAVTGVPKQEFRPGDEAATAAKLAELCNAAERYGVQPGIEFMAFRSIDTLQTALRYHKLAGHPGLKIVVDALHFHRSGGTPEAIATLDPAIISCFQLCDAAAAAPDDVAREARFGRLLPGKGGLPLGDMLAALSPQTPVGVEVPDMARADLPIIEKAREAFRTSRAVMTAVGL
jgi:sugar phosphate isomerase/epimerase